MRSSFFLGRLKKAGVMAVAAMMIFSVSTTDDLPVYGAETASGSGKSESGKPQDRKDAKSLASGPDYSLKSLAEIYKNDFKIGSVFDTQALTGDSFQLIRHHFNILTAGNAMKPDALTSSKGEYHFDEIDRMLDIIHNAGITVHGHTLAWHSQSAEWLNVGLTRAQAAENLKEYVRTVAGHFKGKVVSWDVLNEAIDFNGSFDGNWHDALRTTANWYIAFGNGAKKGEGPWDYVEMLFREARKADPGATLYYNDYNLNMPEKADAVCAMVNDINNRYQKETGSKRLLIEGVSMQGHYSIGVNPSEVETSIKKFIALGVQISISELDVGVPGANPTGLTKRQEEQQAVIYAKLFQIYKKYAHYIYRVTFWGVDDATSWRSDTFPLLFNGDLSAKQAYYAVADPDGYLSKVHEEGTFCQSADAVFGTPKLDGGQDPIWKKAKEYPVTQQLQAWNYASGTMQLLWDEKALYVLVKVKDPSLDDSSSNLWEQDSVEMFVSETNNRKGTYGDGDGQYRVNYKNVTSFGSTDGEGFQSAARRTKDGYAIEAKIPFHKIRPSAGTKVGFDVQINDASEGTRKGVSTWNDPTGSAYNNTSVFGEAMLIDKNSITTVSQKEVPVSSKPDDSHQWILPSVIAAALATGISIAGILMARKKRK